MERKAILSDTIAESHELSVSRYIKQHGKTLFDMAKQQKLEGVVGKKKDSLYWLGKRTKEWKKVKWMQDDDLICIGYIPKEHGMTNLVLAKYGSENRLRIVKHATLGVSKQKINDIPKGECPFDQVPDGHKDATWLEPVVCTIQYMPSDKSRYRQAVFKGFREDKLPMECVDGA